jgi:hypothetical protein
MSVQHETVRFGDCVVKRVADRTLQRVQIAAGVHNIDVATGDWLGLPTSVLVTSVCKLATHSASSSVLFHRAASPIIGEELLHIAQRATCAALLAAQVKEAQRLARRTRCFEQV